VENYLKKFSIILLALSLLFTNVLATNKISNEEKLQSITKEVSKKHEVEFSLLMAIFLVESKLNPKAVGDGGRSKGLGQIQDDTAVSHDNSLKKLSKDALHNYLLNPKNNANLSAKILKNLLNRYDGDIIYALAAYNAGTKNIDKAYVEKRNPFNISYINKVLQEKKTIEKNYIFILKDYIIINSPIEN
jgi:soluble lytic murein transglycosylase-like protein